MTLSGLQGKEKYAFFDKTWKFSSRHTFFNAVPIFYRHFKKNRQTKGTRCAKHPARGIKSLCGIGRA